MIKRFREIQKKVSKKTKSILFDFCVDYENATSDKAKAIVIHSYGLQLQQEKNVNIFRFILYNINDNIFTELLKITIN